MTGARDPRADGGGGAPGRGGLLLSYAIGGFGLGANSMVLFLLPLRAAELGIEIGVIGVLLGTKGIVEAIVSVPLGGFVDRVGPRRGLILGTGGTAVVAALYPLAGSVMILALLQIAMGIVRPLGWVGAQAYIASLRTGSEQAADAGRFSFVANASHIVSPLLVGFGAQVFGVREAFLVMAGYCLVFLAVSTALPAGGPSRDRDRRRGFRAGAGLMRRKGIQVAMFLTFARLWVPSVWISLFPLFLVEGGVSEGIAGSVISAMGFVSAVVSLSAGVWTRFARPETVTAMGLTCGAVGLALAPVVDSIPLAYVGSVLVGIGLGLSLPLLIVIVTGAAPSEQRGLALGMRASANQAASAVAPAAVGGLIGAVGATAGFGIGGGIAALLVGLAVLRDRIGGYPP
jgi:predicted MFS family arabinose efflux permease